MLDPLHDESGPFTPSSANSHPQFTPIKLGTQNLTPKMLKPPKPPEKPLMPYMRYSRKVWDSVKADHKDSKLWEIGRVIGQKWRELSAGEKQKFVDEYEAEKMEYAEALKAYQNSPAYQQYLAAKEKAAMQQRQAYEERDLIKSRSAPTPTISAATSQMSSVRQHQRMEPRLGMPPVDMDVEDLDYWPIRRIAGARYHRNQKLLLEVFSDASVPDLRGIVTLPRMNMLKRQVHSLSMHQKKLENELEQLEEQFETKKRCLHKSHQAFLDEMEKYRAPAADAATYQNMVSKASEQLLEEYARYKNSLEVQKEESAPSAQNGELETKDIKEEQD